MKFVYGAAVYGADERKIGKLKDMVVDPRFRVVTHLVVQEGLLFEHDRLVSVEHVKEVTDEGIRLSLSAELVEEMTNEYDSDEYVPLEDPDLKNVYGVSGAVWVRPTSTGLQDVPYSSVVPPGIGPLEPEPEVHIPGDEVMLERGAVVNDTDGVRLGTVDELHTDDDDAITHMVIQEGGIFSEPKIIPIDWIREIDDNSVTLSVSKAVVDKLHPSQ